MDNIEVIISPDAVFDYEYAIDEIKQPSWEDVIWQYCFEKGKMEYGTAVVREIRHAKRQIAAAGTRANEFYRTKKRYYISNGLQTELNRMIEMIDGNVRSAQRNLQATEEKYIRNGLYAEVFAWLEKLERPLYEFVPNDLCKDCIKDLYDVGELTDKSWIARVPVYDETREQDIILVYLRNLQVGGCVWELKGITTAMGYDEDTPAGQTLAWLNSTMPDNDFVIEERVKKVLHRTNETEFVKIKREVLNEFSEETDKRSAETLLLLLTFGSRKQRRSTAKNH